MLVFVSSVGCLCVIAVALDCCFGFLVLIVLSFHSMNLSFRCCSLICFMLLVIWYDGAWWLICCSGAWCFCVEIYVV